MFLRKNAVKKFVIFLGFIYISCQYVKHFKQKSLETETNHPITGNIPASSSSEHYTETRAGKIRICTQEQRKAHLQEQCQKMPAHIQQRKPTLERLLVDHEHKVVYCVIPKAACTTWKGIMANKTSTGYNKFGTKKHWRFPNLVFSPGYLHECGLDYVRDNYTAFWNSTYQHYTKFMVVRDPLQRVLSGYYDKLRDSTPLIPFLGLMRQKFNRTGIVPFSDFVHFLVTPGYGHRADVHWQTYQALCSPCQIQYDYILRVETMEYDQNFILPLLGAKRRKPLPKLNLSPNSNFTLTNKTDHFDDYMTIHSNELEQLLDRYHKDMEAFGYNFDWKTRISHCEIETKTGDKCC